MFLHGRRPGEERYLHLFSSGRRKSYDDPSPSPDEHTARAVGRDPLQVDIAFQAVVGGFAKPCALFPREPIQCPNPKRSIGALMNRSNLVSGQTLARSKAEKAMAIVTIKSVLRTDPEGALAIVRQSRDRPIA